MKVARSAIYGDGDGLGLTEGDGIGVGVGTGVGVGVAVKRISAGVDPGSTMSMTVRVSTVLPVCAPAFVFAVVFVPVAAFVPASAAIVELPVKPLFAVAALVIPIA